MRRDVARNIIKIAKCLKQAEEGWLWYREIARRCNLHHKTVSRLIERYLSVFVEIQSLEPFNIKMVRLKPGTEIEGIVRYLAIKERLRPSLL